jgi:hypothetical protein
MRNFIKKIIRFSSFCIVSAVFILIMIVHSIGKENLPALNFTSSYSYNEKLLFMKKQTYSPEIISIGSSMSLRNLDSKVIIQELQTDKYLNTASWGIKIQEAFYLLKVLNKIDAVKKVIISSNLIDFQDSNKTVNYDFISAYLKNNKKRTSFFAIKNFSLAYYRKNIEYANHVRTNVNNYEYLKFDNYGMAAQKKEGFNISERRWLDKCLAFKPSEVAYSYLDSISNYCDQKDIKLYFFHSPHREGLTKDFSVTEKEVLENHIERVETILSNKHHFVNPNKTIWNDSLFIDGIHFNKTGANLYTQYSFNQIK